MTERIDETDAKQGRNGIRVALIVITSMVALGFVGWTAIFATGA